MSQTGNSKGNGSESHNNSATRFVMWIGEADLMIAGRNQQ